MNKLNKEKQAQIVSALLKEIRFAPQLACAEWHLIPFLSSYRRLAARASNIRTRRFAILPCKLIQCDEIWCFVGAKEKNATPEQKEKHGWGDVWTWVAIDPVSKLVPSFMVGDRGAQTAYSFMHDLASRLANRVQLTMTCLKLRTRIYDFQRLREGRATEPTELVSDVTDPSSSCS